jgi:hypothetical protein
MGGTNMLPIEDPRFIVDPELNFLRQELIDFLAYWHAKRGARPFPGRKDIVPREIEKLLPWVQMYDVVDGGKEFRVRLIGTALSDTLGGGDYSGKPISEMPQLLSRRIQRGINLVLKNRAPLRTYAIESAIPGQDFQGNESCLAPLSTNGTDIDIIIVVAILQSRK